AGAGAGAGQGLACRGSVKYCRRRLPSRIGIVTTSWPADDGDPSGHFVRAEARALERAGVEVVVLAPPAGGAFGWPGAAVRLKERPLRAVSAARWVGDAAFRARSLAVDRFLCHWAVPSAWPIAHLASAPIEVVSHGADVRLLAALPAPIRERLVRTLARRCERWRFVSESLLAELLREVGSVTSSRVERVATVQAPSIDLPDVASAVERLRAELGGRRTAVSVGRLVASKRVDRAIAHVAASDAFDSLVVVGDGPERARLERIAREKSRPTRFVGAVRREEALAWIGAADALIHASTAEGLSTVVREAEALGTRVVRV
ncbi:MAG: glycosyltransferase family 4 protein, partial [Polyangiaceae bacterium]